MWTCPKCGRAFQRQNQGHYCGKAPETIAEYIASQSPEAQPHLNVLHSLIREILPEAKAEIKWSMPTYRSGAFSLSFAACKKQVSLYADSDILAFFAPQLQEFVIRKNAIYLPYNKALPTDIIGQILAQYSKKQGDEV